jgi:hypothetical protein
MFNMDNKDKEPNNPTLFPTVGEQVEQVALTDASTDPDPQPIDVIDSLCMNCHEKVYSSPLRPSKRTR